MSGQLPPRRRRIAGERRPPVGPTVPLHSETAVAETGQVEHEPPAEEVREVETAAPTPADEPVDRADGGTDGELEVREPRRSRVGAWWGSRASIAVLATALVLLLLVTGLALAGLLGNPGVREIREASQVREAEETAPSVAERAAEAILAYDHATLDADQDAAERFMTQQFAEKYSDSFTKAVAPAARTFKAQVTSEVLGSSVVRATADRVRVLVFVDQTTVATNKENPQVALNRVEFDMVLRGGTWLVDDITSY